MALRRSVEGAEDEESAGAFALDERGMRTADVVIGITASGRTPFVLGALARAKSLGTKTILLTCNPAAVVVGVDCGPMKSAISPTSNARPGSPSPATDLDLLITLPVGPEILAGSTRLKAGTATKVALNIISTGAMIGLGKVRGNLMRLSCLDFGMHAGYVPNHPASHGCIRLPEDTARKFFSEIPVGTVVTVQ